MGKPACTIRHKNGHLQTSRDTANEKSEYSTYNEHASHSISQEILRIKKRVLLQPKCEPLKKVILTVYGISVMPAGKSEERMGGSPRAHFLRGHVCLAPKRSPTAITKSYSKSPTFNDSRQDQDTHIVNSYC